MQELFLDEIFRDLLIFLAKNLTGLLNWRKNFIAISFTLMTDIPGDLVQQASYLEGGPLMWILPLYLHVNQKSDYDIMMQNAIY